MPHGRPFLACLALLAAALAAPLDAAPARSELRVVGLPVDAPLTVAASATQSELVVDVEVERGWRLVGTPQDGPLRLELAADAPFVAVGPLVLPADAATELAGRARLVLPIERTAGARGRAALPLAATLTCVAQDQGERVVPLSLAIVGEVAPLSVLLVTAAEDARAARIADWIAARGFEVRRATYATVSLAACDGADLVVADSDVFRRHGVGIDTVRAFPPTASPVFAVGFLGTELIEAHGVSLASGYV